MMDGDSNDAAAGVSLFEAALKHVPSAKKQRESSTTRSHEAASVGLLGRLPPTRRKKSSGMELGQFNQYVKLACFHWRLLPELGFADKLQSNCTVQV